MCDSLFYIKEDDVSCFFQPTAVSMKTDQVKWMHILLNIYSLQRISALTSMEVDDIIPNETHRMILQNVWFHVLCILFWMIPGYFRLWQGHQINFAEMHRSHGSINRETSGNPSLTGLIQNDSGSVSEAQSCRITLVSKSLLANKTVYKHKWKQTLAHKCTHMLMEACAETHTLQ